jgi:hypothetical protein
LAARESIVAGDDIDHRFPSIEHLLASSSPPTSPTQQEFIRDFQSLTPELQRVAPFVAELMTEGIASASAWAAMSAGERNIMIYGAVSLLAKARQRALETACPGGRPGCGAEPAGADSNCPTGGSLR